MSQTSSRTDFDFADAFWAPIVTFDSSWDIPDNLSMHVVPARLGNLHKGLQIGTIEEAACYLCTRANASPMGSEWTEIFLYVCATVIHKHKNEDHFDMLQAPRELSPYLQDKLNRLLLWIYETRRKHYKKRKPAWQ